MKRIASFLLLLLFLITGCYYNHGTHGKICRYGVCLSYETNNLPEELVPTELTIKISNNKDMDRLDLWINGTPFHQDIIFDNIHQISGEFRANDSNINEISGWYEQVNANEELIITTEFILPKPSTIQPYTHYELLIGILLPEGGWLQINPSFYLGQDGKAMTRAEANKLTLVPIGITQVPGGVIIGGTLSTFVPTRTPSPEKTQEYKLDLVTGTPTITPTATITPTFPAYPGP
jgi:hypothetical protein